MLLAMMLGATSFNAVKAQETQELFTGDKKLACEAIICLVGGWGESECQPSIRRFFSIWSWKPSRLFSKRMSFLGLCPSDMPSSEISLISNYAGRCSGSRVYSYARGIGSSYENETEQDIVRAPCTWNDSAGSWVAGVGVPVMCTHPQGTYEQRLSIAKQQCTTFYSTFGVE